MRAVVAVTVMHVGPTVVCVACVCAVGVCGCEGDGSAGVGSG